MRLEYRAVMDLCKKCGVEVPTNVRVDQQLATRLIDQCTAAIAGLVDPSDATATAADIIKNKTAYGAAGKMTGTLVAVDTSDATAVATDITRDKTAYVNGVKVTGTSVAVDTSDATATAADITKDKTAYVNGVKIVGTKE